MQDEKFHFFAKFEGFQPAFYWSSFAERLVCRLALFRYRLGAHPCRWLCALPKGLYRPKRRQMGRQMGRQMNLHNFLHTLGPNCLCKYVLIRQGGRVEPQLRRQSILHLALY